MDEKAMKLMERVREIWNRGNIMGAAVAIASKQESHLLCLGYSNKKNRLPVENNTKFQIASLSKTFTAWGIMKLSENREIDLDASIKCYFDKDSLNMLALDQITIRQLLNHTAGLSSRFFLGTRNQHEKTTEELLEQKRLFKQSIPPGSEYKYTASGYILLQHIIEKVRSEPFSQYMQKEVLAPLYMENSSFHRPLQGDTQLAKPYGLFFELHNRHWDEKAAAGMYSTISDMLLFLQANIRLTKRINQVLACKTFIEMITKMPGHVPYGLGYLISEKNGYSILSHNGMNLGYSSMFTFLKKKPYGILVLTNSTWGTRFCTKVSDAFIDCYTNA